MPTTITLTVPDADAARVIDGVSGYLAYSATIRDRDTGQSIQNPQTRAQFVKAHVIAYLRGMTVAFEHRAQRAAISPPAPPTIT